jgi:hypothetical protein
MRLAPNSRKQAFSQPRSSSPGKPPALPDHTRYTAEYLPCLATLPKHPIGWNDKRCNDES